MNRQLAGAGNSKLLTAVAEASAWIALLHGPRRTPAAERGFQHWLSESELHKRAFEHATDTWNRTRGQVRRSARVSISVPGEDVAVPRRKKSVLKYAAAAAVLLGVGMAAFYLQRPSLATAVGERRVVMLEDGTQVSMNTATRLRVSYNKNERRVYLETGEALFDVARHPERPFTVVAGPREITALGTSFLVRRDERQLAVTLVEGKVAVTGEEKDSVTLAPGQRLMVAEHEAPRMDRPAVEKLTAWQQGLVNIDNLPLSDALAEMNRYSTTELTVEGPAADLRVSGVFRVTDSENMARVVAVTHGLKLRRDGLRIVLSGTPRAPSESRLESDLSR